MTIQRNVVQVRSLTEPLQVAKAINERFERTGALFQGAFRAKLVDRDEYLLHLTRYIHLNPVSYETLYFLSV